MELFKQALQAAAEDDRRTLKRLLFPGPARRGLNVFLASLYYALRSLEKAAQAAERRLFPYRIFMRVPGVEHEESLQAGKLRAGVALRAIALAKPQTVMALFARREIWQSARVPHLPGPISMAIYCGKPELVEFFLNLGLPVNERYADFDEMSALHVAVHMRDAESLKRLLAKGADPSLTTRQSGLTPAQFARQEGAEDLALLLDAAQA